MKTLYSNKKTSKATFILLVVIVLCCFRFYYYYQFSTSLEKLPGMILIPLMVLLCIKQIFCIEKDIFYRLMQCLVFSWALSFLTAYIFWEQPFMLTYRASTQPLFFVIFFFFCRNGIDRTTLEKIIVLFGWLYIILWLYAMSRTPEITFGATGDDMDDITNMDRGILRINFTGWTSMTFAYFYYFNKCFTSKSTKYKIFAGIFFMFIVFQVTRQLILCVAIVSLVFIFFKSKKISTICGIIFFALYIGSANIEFSNDSIIGSLVNLTNAQMKGDLYTTGEDPRVLEYEYFFTKWSKNTVTSIFGNGVPHDDSSYGQYSNNLKLREGLYLSDVGYPSMYVIVGIFGLAIYFILFLKGTLQKLPSEINYARMFMGFMLISNFISAWYMSADSLLALCISVYLIYLYRKGSPLLQLNNRTNL